MYANISKNNRISQWNCDGYRSGTATNIVLADSCFLFGLCLADSPIVISEGIWSSHPCGFFAKHAI